MTGEQPSQRSAMGENTDILPSLDGINSFPAISDADGGASQPSIKPG